MRVLILAELCLIMFNFSEFSFYHQALVARFTKSAPLTITSLKQEKKKISKQIITDI